MWLYAEFDFTGVFSLQFDILAELLQDGGFAEGSSSPIGPTPTNVGLDGSPQQQHTAPTTPTMVGDRQFQLEPTNELTPAYSDTLLTYTSTFTGDDVLRSSGGDTDLVNFVADANFGDVLYPCNELSVSEADLENWDLSSLLAAV